MPKPTNAELAQQKADLEQELAETKASLEQAVAAAEAAHDEAPAPAEKPANVIEAILAVMREVKVVKKEERNTTPGQSYNFRGIDATVNALGPAMRKHGLVCIPTMLSAERRGVQTSKGNNQQASEVTVEFRFYGPRGVDDTVSAIVPGESWDSGDKGVAKAMSVAYRIALLQTFALPTDERDPDLDTHERAHNVDPRAFLGEVDHALKAADPRQALINLGDSHTTAVLDLVTVPNPAGEGTITATALIWHHLNAIANTPKAAPDEVVEALQAAKELSDAGDDDALLDALRAMYPRFKEVLTTTTVMFDGAPTIVDVVIKKIVADVQAKQEAAHAQETADARDTADAQPENAPDAREQDAQDARAPQTPDAEPTRAPEPTGEQRAAAQTARDTENVDPVWVPLRDMVAGQAAALGVSPAQHITPLLAMKQGATHLHQLPVGLVVTWLGDQKPAVLAAMRAQGLATQAASYEAQGPGAIAPWETLTGSQSTAGEEQDARESQTQS